MLEQNNDSSCLLLVGGFASFFSTCLGSDALPSFEMDYLKKLTHAIDWLLVRFFSLKVKFFSRSQLLTASVLLSKCSLLVPYTNTSS